MRLIVADAEPRVLTLEEIEASDVVWMNVSDTVIAAVYDVFSSTPNFWDFHTKLGTWSMVVREYGRTWRCWSSRPTDKLRKSVPWDAYD